MALMRRALIGAGAAGGFAAAGVAGYEIGTASSPEDAPDRDAAAFHGRHQAGIATRAQDRLHFAAFDVVAPDREDMRDLLRAWTAAAARMTAGARPSPAPRTRCSRRPIRARRSALGLRG